jgi:hypothetical protein
MMFAKTQRHDTRLTLMFYLSIRPPVFVGRTESTVNEMARFLPTEHYTNHHLYAENVSLFFS